MSKNKKVYKAIKSLKPGQIALILRIDNKTSTEGTRYVVCKKNGKLVSSYIFDNEEMSMRYKYFDLPSCFSKNAFNNNDLLKNMETYDLEDDISLVLIGVL